MKDMIIYQMLLRGDGKNKKTKKFLTKVEKNDKILKSLAINNDSVWRGVRVV